MWDGAYPVAVAFSAESEVYVLSRGKFTGLRKFSADGTEQWTKQFMCEESEYPFDHHLLSVAPNGDLVISSTFSGACDLDGSPLDILAPGGIPRTSP